MHEAALALAAIPEYTRILRLPLKPYSLGHELALFRRNNPFVTHSPQDFKTLSDPKKKAALTEAVLVCSRSWKENLHPPAIKNQRIWNFIISWCDLNRAIADFENYKSAAHAEFKAELPSNSGCGIRFIGAPQSIRLYQFIIKTVPAYEILQYGKSVWDYPYGLALMMMQTQAEDEGNLEIYNHRLKFHDDYVEKMEAERIQKAQEDLLKGDKCRLS